MSTLGQRFRWKMPTNQASKLHLQFTVRFFSSCFFMLRRTCTLIDYARTLRDMSTKNDQKWHVKAISMSKSCRATSRCHSFLYLGVKESCWHRRHISKWIRIAAHPFLAMAIELASAYNLGNLTMKPFSIFTYGFSFHFLWSTNSCQSALNIRPSDTVTHAMIV